MAASKGSTKNGIPARAQMLADVHVVEFPGSKELVYWLEARLNEALRGQLIGITAVCMYSHSDYAISVKGETRRSPIMTRGLLPEVDHLLGRIMAGGEHG